MKTGVASLLLLLVAAVGAAEPLPPPPRLEPGRDAGPPAEAQAKPPRRVIRAPDVPPPAPQGEPRKPDAPAPLAEPAPGEELPPARRTETEVRFDQRRLAAGVTEITVTPAYSVHSYVILNREDQRRAPAENQSSLSIPRFLRFDF